MWSATVRKEVEKKNLNANQKRRGVEIKATHTRCRSSRICTCKKKIKEKKYKSDTEDIRAKER
jgi:Tfp pilus assembly major pilin PilA